MKKVVLLNDTTPDNHYGCTRVINNLNTLIAESGGIVTHSLKIDQKIFNSETKQYLQQADIVIINGEGTFHHGAQRAHDMLKLVADLPLKKYLVNATYDSNPDIFAKLLKNFDSVTVRETRSQRQLKEQGIDSIVIPDLSLYSELCTSTDRKGFLYGDSVNFRLAWKMHQLFHNKADFNVNRICYTSNRWAQVNRYILKGLRKFDFTKFKTRNLFIAREQMTPEQYHREIAHANGIITGRYHAICYAINSLTPFLAVSSNSHKVEGLMEDIGLQRRIIASSQLENFEGIEPLTNEDVVKIEAFLSEGRKNMRTFYHSVFND